MLFEQARSTVYCKKNPRHKHCLGLSKKICADVYIEGPRVHPMRCTLQRCCDWGSPHTSYWFCVFLISDQMPSASYRQCSKQHTVTGGCHSVPLHQQFLFCYPVLYSLYTLKVSLCSMCGAVIVSSRVKLHQQTSSPPPPLILHLGGKCSNSGSMWCSKHH